MDGLPFLDYERLLIMDKRAPCQGKKGTQKHRMMAGFIGAERKGLA
jgi:hypothetical protein